MPLIDLPAVILSTIPDYLHSLNDWYALIRSSRVLYTACAASTATYPRIFPGDPNDHSCSAYGHFIIAGSARQLADWAVHRQENRLRLGKLLDLGGNQELLEFCINIVRWSPAHVRALYKAKVEVIYPLSRLLDGDRTVKNSIQPFYVYVIYCELFHHTIDEASGQLPANVVPLPDKYRYHWLLHCFPNLKHDLLDVRYMQRSEIWFSLPDLLISPNLVSRATVLHWKAYREPIYQGQDPRDALLYRVMAHQGLHALRLMLPDLPNETRELVWRIRSDIHGMRCGKVQRVHYNGVWRSLAVDMNICVVESV